MVFSAIAEGAPPDQYFWKPEGSVKRLSIQRPDARPPTPPTAAISEGGSKPATPQTRPTTVARQPVRTPPTPAPTPAPAPAPAPGPAPAPRPPPPVQPPKERKVAAPFVPLPPARRIAPGDWSHYQIPTVSTSRYESEQGLWVDRFSVAEAKRLSALPSRLEQRGKLHALDVSPESPPPSLAGRRFGATRQGATFDMRWCKLGSIGSASPPPPRFGGALSFGGAVSVSCDTLGTPAQPHTKPPDWRRTTSIDSLHSTGLSSASVSSLPAIRRSGTPLGNSMSLPLLRTRRQLPEATRPAPLVVAENDPHRELYCALDLGLGEIAEEHREHGQRGTKLPPFECQPERLATIDALRREQYDAEYMRCFVSTPSSASRPSMNPSLAAPTRQRIGPSVVHNHRLAAYGLSRPSSVAAV